MAMRSHLPVYSCIKMDGLSQIFLKCLDLPIRFIAAAP